MGQPAIRVAAQSLQSQPVVVLSNTQDVIPLEGNTLSFLRDSTHVRSLNDVSHLVNQVAFQPVESPVANFGISSGGQVAPPVWLRFRVRNPAAQPQRWLAEVDFLCFDTLRLFVVDARGQTLSASPAMGWKTRASERLLHNRHFWFPFAVPAGQTVTVYLRVMKQRGMQIVPVELVRESAYESVTQRSYFCWGGVLITLTFVAVMSLIFFLTTLSRIYLKYIFCLLGLVGFFFINGGFLNQFGFDAQFWMPRQNVYFLFPLVLFYSQLAFVHTFLNLRHTPSHRWHTVGTVVFWSSLVCMVSLTAEWFVLLNPVQELVLTRLFVFLYWLPLPVIVGYIGINIVRRYQVAEAWLYLIAVLPFYTLNFGLVFANFGLVTNYRPISDFAYYAPAALFEVLVLTIGIAYRYKKDRDRSERLITESTRQQQRAYEAEVQALAMKNNLLVEKERIARDLHDNVGAHLAFIVTNLSHISDQAEKQPVLNGKHWAERLRTIVAHTREAVKLLRETIWAIHQESFTVAEFTERLEQYINRYFHEDEGLHVDLSVTGDQTQALGSAQVLNLFRIVQESLNNVVKHAGATKALVQLKVKAGGRINLQIRDNGQGFTWSDGTALAHHYGLQNMQTRARELGGTFRIFADNGTIVEVAV